MVFEVEVRVVDPDRAPRLQRGRGQLLAIARDEMETAANVIEIVGESRRWPLEQQHGADMHVRRRSLLVQKGGVGRAQSVEVVLGHGFSED